MTGAARIQQNGIWSNALQFIVPTLFGSANEITMAPNSVSMLVGETRTIQALNSSGAPVSGLVWASSDTTVVSLSTDDPPMLTALAPGHVSVTAGDASAEVTVYAGSSLPTGTVIWSAAGDGSGVRKILPAVPSPTGVADVFALQKSGNVEAITSDGSVAWTANIGNYQSFFCPDFQGGLVALTSNNTVVRFDGMTGQANTLYTVDPLSLAHVEGVHTDGTIFVLQEPPDGTSAALVGLDPATGRKFTIPLDHFSFTDTYNCTGSGTQSFRYSPLAGPFVIAGDGNAYFLYEYGTESATSEASQYSGFCNTTDSRTGHLVLLRISPNGSTQKTVIGDWNEVYAATFAGYGYQITDSAGEVPFPVAGGQSNLVTNGASGVTLALNYSIRPYCPQGTSFVCNTALVPAQVVNRLLTISGGGVESDVNLNWTPPNSQVHPILQAEDGTYFGTVVSYLYYNTSMDAFDKSGNLKWTVAGGFTPVMATADSGLIAKSSTGQYVTFDKNGVANGMLAQLPTQSWIGNAYQVGSIDRVAATPISFAPSFLAMPGGNQTGNGTAIQQVQTNFPQVDVETPPASNAATDLSNYGANYSAVEILTSATPDYIFQNYVQQYRGVQQRDNNSVGFVPNGTSVTSVGQEVTFTLNGLPSYLQKPFSVRMKAFDATAHVMAVVTLKGHPLFGRRYWRVFSNGPGDVVVETGAIDTPACPSSPLYETVVFSCTNYWGYYVFTGPQTKIWAQELQYILNDLKLRGFGSQKGTTPAYNYLNGKWGWDVSFRSNYLWPYLCYESACQ